MQHDLPDVLVLYNLPDAAGSEEAYSESEAAIIEEVRAVASSLDAGGIRYRTAAVRRLTDISAILSMAPEPIVFNLVEALDGPPDDFNYVPALCEAFGKVSTGAGTPCLCLTLNKAQTKAVLQDAGITVPRGLIVPCGAPVPASGLPPFPVIVKPCSTDASEGITASAAFVKEPGPALEAAVALVHANFQQPALVEQYVGSRELNISILERGGQPPATLPLAEIEFADFGDRPKIVDYAAKWVSSTFEYRHTRRVIPARLDDATAGRVRAAALASWHATGCMDYARVDMRMDDDGTVYVLEVNANPDISRDAGFPAALAAAEIPYADFIVETARNAAQRLRARGWAPPKHLPIAPPETTPHTGLEIRYSCRRDRDEILAFVEQTGFFRSDEIEIAREVLDDALANGPDGHYQSFTAEMDGRSVGWICYGPTPCTRGTFDIYWVAVHPDSQRKGIGRALMLFAEKQIAARGGRLAAIDTSGRAIYEPTRLFYEKIGYEPKARIPEFYGPTDDKFVYVKTLSHAVENRA